VIDEALLDLDGVLVDFVRGSLAFHDKYIPYSEVTWDFADRVFPGEPEKFWEPLSYDFWANLPKTPQCDALVEGLIEIFGAKNICICTSPIQTPGCIDGKLEWVRRNLPKCFHRQYMICPVKHFAAASNRILIDDRDENIVDFVKAGGRGRLIPQPWNCLARIQFSVGEILLDVAKRSNRKVPRS
jgi:5'(3')-deoxyribonucleotidase